MLRVSETMLWRMAVPGWSQPTKPVTRSDTPPRIGRVPDMDAMGLSGADFRYNTTPRHGSGAVRADRDNFLRDLPGSGCHGFCRHSITSVRLFLISLSEALSWMISRSCSQTLCLSSILACAVNNWTACTTRD